MFCPYCGAACEENHRFCFRCGKPLPELTENHIEEATPVTVPVNPEPMPESVTPESPAEVDTPETPAETQEPESIPQEPQETPVPSAPKGRLWPPVLVLALVACFGLAVYFISTFGGTPPVKSDTPWFSISNGVLDFHEEYYAGDAELVIPSVIDGQTVTAIADHAFSGCDLLSTVILPDTLIRIGEYSFSGCGELRGIYIPRSVKSVGSYAFADCDELEAISIPGTLEQIGHSALDSCDGLKFIMFDGTCARWNELYDGRFVTEVELHASDGVFYAKP